MELNNKNTNNEAQQIAYEKALARVKKIKAFYTHFLVYISINIFLILLHIYNLGPNESIFQFQVFSTAFFWGIGLLAHAASVYLPNVILSKNWEQKKINEFIEKERLNK